MYMITTYIGLLGNMTKQNCFLNFQIHIIIINKSFTNIVADINKNYYVLVIRFGSSRHWSARPTRRFLPPAT